MIQVIDPWRRRPVSPAEAIVAVVIPAFRVADFVLDVLQRIGPEIDLIYVVDDCCPEQSGKRVEAACTDPRVKVIFHSENRGVGGATLSGYRQAIADGADVIVKLDGDGQMNPALIGQFVQPVLMGLADYSKGNRFFNLEDLRGMPWVRTFGNGALSFISKISTGYWDIVDPTNGFTCIHAAVAADLPFDKLSQRYFFESDLLFRLGLARAVVVDVPMSACYGDERSGLKAFRIIPEFLAKHARNWCKRFVYSYVLRNFTAATLEAFVGAILLIFGTVFGATKWYAAAAAGVTATSGTVMLAAISVLLGTQFLLAALSYDIQNIPRQPLQHRLAVGATMTHGSGVGPPPGGDVAPPPSRQAANARRRQA